MRKFEFERRKGNKLKVRSVLPPQKKACTPDRRPCRPPCRRTEKLCRGQTQGRPAVPSSATHRPRRNAGRTVMTLPFCKEPPPEKLVRLHRTEPDIRNVFGEAALPPQDDERATGPTGTRKKRTDAIGTSGYGGRAQSRPPGSLRQRNFRPPFRHAEPLRRNRRSGPSCFGTDGPAIRCSRNGGAGGRRCASRD